MATKTFLVMPDPADPDRLVVVPGTITLKGNDEIRAEVADSDPPMVGVASCSAVSFNPATMAPGSPAVGVVTGRGPVAQVKFEMLYRGSKVVYGTLTITG